MARFKSWVFIYCVLIISQSFGDTAPKQPEVDGEIATLAELRWLSQNDTEWNKDWKLVANIDASDTKTWNDGEGFSPIGNSDRPFTGTFEGTGYNTISNLFIDRTGYVGLFGYVDEATIRNLNLTSADITGTYAGILCGYAQKEEDEETLIREVHVSGSVTGVSYVGGLVGRSRTGLEIEHSSSVSTIVGTHLYTGGLVGYAQGIKISSSYSFSNIQGDKSVGGLVGYSTNTEIVQSFSGGSVARQDIDEASQLGGIAGFFHNGRVAHSYSITNVENNDHANEGCLIGYRSSTEIANIFYDTNNLLS